MLLNYMYPYNVPLAGLGLHYPPLETSVLRYIIIIICRDYNNYRGEGGTGARHPQTAQLPPPIRLPLSLKL